MVVLVVVNMEVEATVVVQLLVGVGVLLTHTVVVVVVVNMGMEATVVVQLRVGAVMVGQGGVGGCV